jgi:hypothetical protein
LGLQWKSEIGGTNWNWSTNAPIVVQAQNQVIEPSSAGARFYRLASGTGPVFTNTPPVHLRDPQRRRIRQGAISVSRHIRCSRFKVPARCPPEGRLTAIGRVF